MFHSRQPPGKRTGCLPGMQGYCTFYPNPRPGRKRAYYTGCGQYAPIEENGQFRSTKHEGFGTGTASVRAIAQRHHGVTEFRYEDGIFYVSVFI